jgi:hypothetical protein
MLLRIEHVVDSFQCFCSFNLRIKLTRHFIDVGDFGIVRPLRLWKVRHNPGLAKHQSPRVTLVVASLEPRTLGAAMKEISGTLRTNIQGPGSSSAVAACAYSGERDR